MSSFKRIISFICTFAITISLMAVPALAAETEYKSVSNVWTWASNYSWGLGAQLLGLASDSVCTVSDDEHHHAASYERDLDNGYYICICQHCGESFQAYEKDLTAAYSTYASTLDSTTAYSGVRVDGVSCTTLKSTTNLNYYPGVGFHTLVNKDSNRTHQLLESLGINERVLIYGCAKNSPQHLVGLYFSSSGRLCQGAFKNPLGQANALVIGVYELSSLEVLESCESNVYYSKSYAEAQADFLTGEYYAFDWSVRSMTSRYPYLFSANVFVKLSTSIAWKSSSELKDLSLPYDKSFPYLNTSCGWYYPDSSSVTFGSSHVVYQPSGTDLSSRPISVKGNYGIVGDDGTVVNVYNTVPYDEETRIFTEPQTGTQYQTTGWTYDYNDRAYLLTLESGTMTVNDTDVALVGIAYGDEEMAIVYVDASGNVLAIDTYAYLVETTSSDDGDGGETDDDKPLFCLHSYVDEVTKEATCTTSGEMVSTCSKCGKVRTTAIFPIGHTYSVKSSVPTSYDDAGNVAVEGYTIYKCDNCDNEYKSTDNSGPDMDKDGFLSWLWKLITKPIERVVDGLLGLFDFIFPADGQSSLDFYTEPSTFSGVSVWES